MDFFAWMGVKTVLRPVHFHDVRERGRGWLQTKNLQRPESSAFQQLEPQLWDEFKEQTRSLLNPAAGSEKLDGPVHGVGDAVP